MSLLARAPLPCNKALPTQSRRLALEECVFTPMPTTRHGILRLFMVDFAAFQTGPIVCSCHKTTIFLNLAAPTSHLTAFQCQLTLTYPEALHWTSTTFYHLILSYVKLPPSVAALSLLNQYPLVISPPSTLLPLF